MRYARVTDGQAAEIWEAPDGVTPDDAFVKEVAADFGPCPEVGREGWSSNGSSFAPPVESPPLSAPVLGSLTRAPAKVQLHRAGILNAVKTALSSDPELEIPSDEATTWGPAGPKRDRTR